MQRAQEHLVTVKEIISSRLLPKLKLPKRPLQSCDQQQPRSELRVQPLQGRT